MVIARPPGVLLREPIGEGDPRVRETACDQTVNTGSATRAIGCPESWEKRLVLLAGRRWKEFSLVRAFFDIREGIAWRDSAQGYDPKQPVMEPVGSLVIRSGAIRIGRALTDILFERSYRESRIANPLRRWISDLYGKPRRWLQTEILTWPAAERTRWKRQFRMER